MRCAITILILTIGTLGAVPSTVRAQAEPAADPDARARARTHFETGQARVAERRFDDAYLAFEAGYELSRRPLFLFNMAECAREAGHTSQARRDYARYVEADPTGTHAELARERLAILGPEPVAPTPEAIPEPAPSAPTPEETAAAAVRASADPEPPVRAPELWEDWPFWTIAGAIVVAAAVGTSVGVAATSGGGAPACNTGCAPIDWR